jgi:hypothetical protein
MNINVEDIYAEIGRLTVTIRAHEAREAQLEAQVKLLQERLEQKPAEEEVTTDG